MKIIRYIAIMLCGFMLVGGQAYALTIEGPPDIAGDEDSAYVKSTDVEGVYEVEDDYYDNHVDYGTAETYDYGGSHWQGWTIGDTKQNVMDIIDITDIDDYFYEASHETDNDGDFVGVDEKGEGKSSYETSFSDTENNPSDANITWLGGDFIDPEQDAYLEVKDGNHDPIWYLFDLKALGWDGKDIDLNNFWEDRGSISHVRLWANATQVPEPAVMLLMGAGIAGIAAFGRRRRAKRNT